MADGEPAALQEPSVVTLVIKNPSASSPGDFRIDVPVEATVLAVKQRLQRDYVGNPNPSRQKLIVAGQLIKDVSYLRDVFKQKNLTEPQVMHLVVAAGGLESAPPATAGSSNGSSAGQPARTAATVAAPSGFAPTPVSSVGRARSIGGSESPSQAVPGPGADPGPASPAAPIGHGAPSAVSAGPSASPTNSSEPPPQGPPQLSAAGPSAAPPPEAGPSEAGPSASASASASQTPPPAVGATPWQGMPDAMAMGAGALHPEALNLAMLQMYGGVVLSPYMAAMSPTLAAYNAALLNPAAFGGMSPQYPGFMAPLLPPGLLPAYYPPLNEQQQRQQPGGVFAIPAMPMPVPLPVPGGGPAGAAFGVLPFNVPLGAPMQMMPGGLQVAAPMGGQQAGQPQGPAGARQPPAAGAIPVVPLGALGPQGVAVQEARVVGRRLRLQLRLDLMLLLKLAVVVFVFNQDGSLQRFLLLSCLAVLVYLYQTGALAPVVRWLSQATQRALGQPPRPPAPPAAAAAPNAQPGGQEAAADGQGGPAGAAARGSRAQPVPAQQRPGERWGVLREIQLFLVGFVTSLLPGFQGPDQPPPVLEPEVVADANPNRPHQD